MHASDGDSSEAAFSSSPIEANETVDELFNEIDKHHNQESTTPSDLSKEIDAYQEDETGAMEPLDEPVVTIIHSWNTQALKSKITNTGPIGKIALKIVFLFAYFIKSM